MQFRLSSGKLVNLSYPTLGQVRQLLLEDELTNDVINKFVEKSVGEPIGDFYVIDRDAAYWMLIAMLCRGNLTMRAYCSECREDMVFNLDFTEVAVPEVSELEAELELPVSKIKVKLEQPKVKDLEGLVDITDEDLIKIYLKSDIGAIEDLPYIDYLAILAKILSMKVEVEHTFDVSCSKGHLNKVRVGTFNLKTPHTLKTIISDFWNLVKRGVSFQDFLEMTDKEIDMLKDFYRDGRQDN